MGALRTSRCSGSSLMVSSDRALEIEAAGASGCARSPFGRETFRLGGVMGSDEPERMFGGSHSEMESSVRGSKSSSSWGEVMEEVVGS